MKTKAARKTYVMTAKAGDCTVYAEDTFKATGRVKSAQITDNLEHAIMFDDRDVFRAATLVKFWNAVTGLSFEFTEMVPPCKAHADA